MSALGLRREQACFRDRGLYSACRWTSAHMGMAFPCTCTPLSHVHARIGTCVLRFAFKVHARGVGRTPCREAVYRRSGPGGSEQVLQADDPFEAAARIG